MFEFKTPEDEERFTLEFIASPYWAFMKDMLEGRMETLFRMAENPSTTSDGRAMIHGRLIELRYLLNVPFGAAEFYKNKQKILEAGDSQFSEVNMKTLFPDIITH